MHESKITFLYAAIADAQATIRATDTKIGILLVILGIPLTKLGSIYARCSTLLQNGSRCLSEVAAIMTFVFACLWLLSFFAAMRAIIAIDDPAQHIDGAKPSGIFYSGGLFRPTFLDAFLNRPILAKKQLEQLLNELPSSAEKTTQELIFEHAKLVYIRSIKMNRMKYAYIFGIAWVFTGGGLWVMSLVLQKA